MTEHVADPHRECPACGAERERLARHWTSGPCPHPHINEPIRELLTGLVIGNATAAGNGQHNHVVLPTQHREFALWVHEQLGWLSHGVRLDDDAREGRGPQYRVRTHAHPALDRYRDWYDDDKRVPESVALRPRSARAWYACDGGLDYHREDSPPRVTFSTAARVARRREVARLLREAGYDPDVYDRRVRLSVGESERWLAWIGAPVPGAEHKWAQSRGLATATRVLQDAGIETPLAVPPGGDGAGRGTTSEYATAECLEAVAGVAAEAEEVPSGRAYGRRSRAGDPSRSLVGRRLGGWDHVRTLVAERLAEGPPPTPRSDPDDSRGWGGHGMGGDTREYTGEECRNALVRAVGIVGPDITIEEYYDVARPDDPSPYTLCERLGGGKGRWRSAKRAVQ